MCICVYLISFYRWHLSHFWFFIYYIKLYPSKTKDEKRKLLECCDKVQNAKINLSDISVALFSKQELSRRVLYSALLIQNLKLAQIPDFNFRKLPPRGITFPSSFSKEDFCQYRTSVGNSKSVFIGLQVYKNCFKIFCCNFETLELKENKLYRTFCMTNK